MKSFNCLVIALCFLADCQSTENIETVVTTDKGAVEGVYNSETGVLSYKGIPYAQAPTGDLRWEAPQPVKKREGMFDAAEFGAICMQGEPVPFSMWTHEFIAPAGNMSEDCLSLNIWTKEGSVNSNRPVIVFIHGGGFSCRTG